MFNLQTCKSDPARKDCCRKPSAAAQPNLRTRANIPKPIYLPNEPAIRLGPRPAPAQGTTRLTSMVREAMRLAGQSLDSVTRRFMESAFGNDFSRVRIHSDQQAALTAQAVGAGAFTIGQDIFFAAGRYAPADEGGRFLLAHELAHVLQQGGRNQSVETPLQIHPTDAWEREAGQVALRVTRDKAAVPVEKTKEADAGTQAVDEERPRARTWRSSLPLLPPGLIQRQVCRETSAFTSVNHEIVQRWYKHFHPPLLHEYAIPLSPVGNVIGRADLVDPAIRNIWEVAHPTDDINEKRVQVNNYITSAAWWCGRGQAWGNGVRLPAERIPRPPEAPLLTVRQEEPGILRYEYATRPGQQFPDPAYVRDPQLLALLERIRRNQWNAPPATAPAGPGMLQRLRQLITDPRLLIMISKRT